MDIAGYLSRQMLARYSQLRIKAKRKAMESIVSKPVPAPQAAHPTGEQRPASGMARLSSSPQRAPLPLACAAGSSWQYRVTVCP
jgi:hypothetical protein